MAIEQLVSQEFSFGTQKVDWGASFGCQKWTGGGGGGDILVAKGGLKKKISKKGWKKKKL